MRIIFLLIFTLGCWALYAQEPTSFYFTSPQPAGEESLEKIPASFAGSYRHPVDSLKKIFITEDSIYARIIIPNIVTLQEINNDPLLHIEDSLLEGVYKDKAIPFFQSGDTIIYFMADDYLFFKPGEKQVIRSGGESLLLSFQDQNNNWSVLMLSRESNGDIVIAEIDHEQEMDLIKKQKGIKKKRIREITTYFLNLSSEQMSSFIEEGGFNVSSKYKKEE